MHGMADSCAPLQPPFAAAPACKSEEEENLNHYGLTHSTFRQYVYSRKTRVSRNLFWLSTTPAAGCCFCSPSGCCEDEHCPISLSLSLCFACLFPWLKSCRGVVVYMLGWLDTTMTPSYHLLLYYLFPTNRIRNMKKVPQSVITF